MIVVSSSTKTPCVVWVPLIGEDRFEVIVAECGFASEDSGIGIVLVMSSAIVNGVGGGPIAASTTENLSMGVEMRSLTGEFILYGLPSVGLEIVGSSTEVSIWNGELGPSSQVISSSMEGTFALLTGGETTRD